MLQALRVRRAIRSYKKKLGPYLVKNYGKQTHYKPQQVRKGIDDLNLSVDSGCFAYAMYTSKDDFDAHHASTGEICDYDVMRATIGDVDSSMFGSIGDFFHSSDSVDFGGCDSGGDGGD